ncbi:MAG: alanine:cation symporter family protein [Myxococcota bacterium]
MTILSDAFNPQASLGGSVAGTITTTAVWGVRRGLFSNEAGQGSAPIAHAAAKTDEPVREGLVASWPPDRHSSHLHYHRPRNCCHRSLG